MSLANEIFIGSLFAKLASPIVQLERIEQIGKERSRGEDRRARIILGLFLGISRGINSPGRVGCVVGSAFSQLRNVCIAHRVSARALATWRNLTQLSHARGRAPPHAGRFSRRFIVPSILSSLLSVVSAVVLPFALFFSRLTLSRVDESRDTRVNRNDVFTRRRVSRETRCRVCHARVCCATMRVRQRIASAQRKRIFRAAATTTTRSQLREFTPKLTRFVAPKFGRRGNSRLHGNIRLSGYTVAVPAGITPYTWNHAYWYSGICVCTRAQSNAHVHATHARAMSNAHRYRGIGIDSAAMNRQCLSSAF